MKLVFPIVVRVERGEMVPGEVLERHFGVSRLADLPCRKDNGEEENEIQTLLDEVEAHGIPSKRNVLVQPRDGRELLYDCKVYACVEHNGTATILAFEILETFTASGHNDVLIDGESSLEPGRVDASEDAPTAGDGQSSGSRSDPGAGESASSRAADPRRRVQRTAARMRSVLAALRVDASSLRFAAEEELGVQHDGPHGLQHDAELESTPVGVQFRGGPGVSTAAAERDVRREVRRGTRN